MNTSAPRSTFVSVVAWFGIAFGGMGVLVGALQLVMLAVMFPQGALAELANAPTPGMPPWFGWIFGHFHLLVAANLLAMVVLLAASIGLLRRRNWARLTMVLLLALAIVANLGGVGLQFAMMQSMGAMDATSASPEFAADFALMRNVILVMALVFAFAFCTLYGWIIQRLLSPAARAEFGVDRP